MVHYNISKNQGIPQGGGTPLQSVLRAATAIKIKVNSQLEIFSIVNSQATSYISDVHGQVSQCQVKFSDKTYNREIYAMSL